MENDGKRSEDGDGTAGHRDLEMSSDCEIERESCGRLKRSQERERRRKGKGEKSCAFFR